jgi:hypothetical protein
MPRILLKPLAQVQKPAIGLLTDEYPLIKEGWFSRIQEWNENCIYGFFDEKFLIEMLIY